MPNKKKGETRVRSPKQNTQRVRIFLKTFVRYGINFGARPSSSLIWIAPSRCN